MYLKFIGEDKFMGLQRGSIYKVKVLSNKHYIWVWWNLGCSCPYSSPENFAANWVKP